LFRSCNLRMLFKIVKLACQESKGKNQVVEHQENFIYLQNSLEKLIILSDNRLSQLKLIFEKSFCDNRLSLTDNRLSWLIIDYHSEKNIFIKVFVIIDYHL